MNDSPACYAVYLVDSRKIVSFQWVGVPPTLTDSTLSYHAVDAIPEYRPAGYAFDADMNLVEA
jgi:hypothetical protein